MDEARPGHAYAGLLTRAADGMREDGRFDAPEQWRFDWEWTYSRDEWLDQLATHGGHAQLPPAQIEEVQAAVGAVIDDLGGSFTMGYAAVVVIAARIGVA